MKTDERDEFPGLDSVMGLQAPSGRECPAAATIALRGNKFFSAAIS